MRSSFVCLACSAKFGVWFVNENRKAHEVEEKAQEDVPNDGVTGISEGETTATELLPELHIEDRAAVQSAMFTDADEVELLNELYLAVLGLMRETGALRADNAELAVTSRKYENALLADLAPIADLARTDGHELTEAEVRTKLQILSQQLDQVFGARGIEMIPTPDNERLPSRYFEIAATVRSAEHPPFTVTATHRPAYVRGGEVLRRGAVTVVAADDETDATGEP